MNIVVMPVDAPLPFSTGCHAIRAILPAPRAKGRILARLISRVARVRSEDAMLEDLADPTKIGDVEDPRSIAKWAKKMGSALGDEAGEDFGAVVDEMMETEGRGPGHDVTAEGHADDAL